MVLTTFGFQGLLNVSTKILGTLDWKMKEINVEAGCERRIEEGIVE